MCIPNVCLQWIMIRYSCTRCARWKWNVLHSRMFELPKINLLVLLHFHKIARPTANTIACLIWHTVDRKIRFYKMHAEELIASQVAHESKYEDKQIDLANKSYFTKPPKNENLAILGYNLLEQALNAFNFCTLQFNVFWKKTIQTIYTSRFPCYDTFSTISRL